MRFDDIQFTIAGGRTIEIVARTGTPDNDVRVWLLGSVMAILLHQRSYLPIHANLIALAGNRTAAFSGPSGSGKSSLAAWLEARGHVVLADDLCAITIDAAGRPQAFAGIPRLKLWNDALAVLGRDEAGLEPVSSDMDKFHVPLRTSGESGPLAPLAVDRIYLLERCTGAGEQFSITPLKGAEAAYGVLDNTYRWKLGQAIQPPRAQFDQCLALARHAAVFRVRRRWGMEFFDEEAAAIERHMLAPSAARDD